jgi:hypothetical protein
MAATVVSLLMTLIIAAASRIDRKLPPAHRYTLLASALNANLCCSTESDVEKNVNGKEYQLDWLHIHSAINNLLSMALVIAYIIGIVIISF